jgi:hypothetical protein
MLLLESPEQFRELELTAEDAPPGNVAAVEARYFELKQARLLVQEPSRPPRPRPSP